MTRRISVLIVEDEQIVALNVRNRLEEVGYTIAGMVDSGEAALEVASRTLPDLVLMDIRLSGKVDGIEAAEQIRTQLKIPVVYLTAYTDTATVERVKITQPYGYILKPFEARELFSAIEIALYKHQQEQELKTRERWLSTTLQSIGDAVITTDSMGRITFMNPIAETLTGWQQQEAEGQELSRVFHIIDERTRQIVQNPASVALDQGIIVNLDNHVVLVSRQGHEIPIDDSAAPIQDEEGNITGSVLVFHDIIERKLAEQALQSLNQDLERRVEERTQELHQRQQEFVALVEHAPDMIARYDERCRYVYVNPAAQTIMGLPLDAFIGKTDPETGLPTDAAILRENAIRRVFATGEETTIEFSVAHSSQVKYYQSRLVAEWAINGTIASVLCITRDITQSKQAETQLATALEEKNVLLREIHHRVKNNLQTISSLLRLQSYSIQDPKSLELLKESQNRVMAMALVHETLYRSTNLARINFVDYVRKLTAELFKSYGMDETRVTLRLEVSSVELDGDTVIPCGLLINELVSNALLHGFPDLATANSTSTDTREIAIVFTLAPSDRCILQVSDNGIGLSEEINLAQPETLGLQLVRSLTRQLQGSLEVDRTQGTTFRITFPNPAAS